MLRIKKIGMANGRRTQKWLALGLAALTLLFGAACGGSGGGSGIRWPVLPEGDLYYSQEGWARMNEAGTNIVTDDYTLVDSHLDDTQNLVFNGNPMWLEGYQFWYNCFSEEGFTLFLEPDDPQTEISRLSVAIHNKGMNLTPAAVEFIEQDPVNNAFVVLSLINALSSGGGIGTLGLTNSRSLNFRITGGGTYRSVEKAEMIGQIDAFYEALPLLVRLFISRNDFRGYMSQLLYQSTYEGGDNISLSALLESLTLPWNWAGLDFKTTLDIKDATIPAVTRVTAKSGKNYRIQNIKNGQRLYLSGESAYTFNSVPESLRFLQYIRTSLADAARSDTDLVTLTLSRPADVYVGLDPRMAAPAWLNGWENTGVTLGTTFTDAQPMRLYRKNFPAGPVILGGVGSSDYAMYTIVVDAGRFDFGLEVISTARVGLMSDFDQAAVIAPAARSEGGLTANSVSYLDDEILIEGTFVDEFDANVFLDSEANYDTGLDQLPINRLVDQMLRNDGFRLIDTYNDQGPAFGVMDQRLLVESMFGLAINPPLEVELKQANLTTFTNMNLLNSPNLVGLYLKSIATNDPTLALWLNTESPHSRKLNYSVIKPLFFDLPADRFTFFYDSPENPVPYQEILRAIGRNQQGAEVTFGVRVRMDSGYNLDLRAAAFVTDYFTNIYDSVVNQPFGGLIQ
ncbi:MAG TPA: hypothetical protein PKM61_06810 [bacterium]|nr:hypothetical protein [bacterium]